MDQGEKGKISEDNTYFKFIYNVQIATVNL